MEGTRTRAALLAAAAALLLLGAGCARKEAARPPVTLAVGGAPSELDHWEKVVREFEAETGIRVEILRQPSDTGLRRQGLSVALQAGRNDPDVFLMDVAWLPQFAASGWLAPLDPALGKGECGGRDTFFPVVLDLADTYRGETVALPLNVDAGLLYYRTDLLAKWGSGRPPETWEELLRDSLAVQERMRSGHPRFHGFVWQGAQYEGLICNLLEFAGADGGIPLRDGSLEVDTPQNRRALGLMRDLIHRYRVSPPGTYTEMKEEEARTFFQGGDALFERNWPYAWALHEEPGSAVRGVTGIAPLPAFAPGRGISTLGGWHVGLSRTSDAGPEAMRLLCRITSYAVQKEMALRLGWNPGRRDVYGDAELLAARPFLREMREIIERARPRPLVPYYTQLSDILQRRVNAALAGRATPGEALAAAQREIDAAVARYRLP